MEAGFGIVSDGSCDLPEQVVRERGLEIVHFSVAFEGEEYRKEGVEVSLDEFYQRMVDEPKRYPKTAAPSPEDFLEAFRRCAEKGLDVVCVCISTKLSSSVQSAQIAARMLTEEFPGVRVEVVDSLCATLMQSAFVLELCRMRDDGRSVDEVLERVEPLRKSARIFFTVGDLDYIQHGGRIGRMTSIAGTLLNVKPLITLQDGEIHSSGIRRGRRKSLEGVVDLLIGYLREKGCGTNGLTPEDFGILLGYSYDWEEGVRVQAMTQEKLEKAFGKRVEIPLCRIGATIGVHAGPTSLGFGVVRRFDRL